MNKPHHISFIMSGNRTWGKYVGKSAEESHKIGAENIEKIAETCFQEGIPHASFWAMSTENFGRRPESETENLLLMADTYTKKFEKKSKKEEIYFRVVGDISVLSEETRARCAKIERETKHFERSLTILFNYGGQADILSAARKMIADEVAPESVSRELFKSYLQTKDLPDPDLIVRTGGEQRLSGLFSWESVYAELYFTEKKWPEFDKDELQRAISFFSRTQRNFGK